MCKSTANEKYIILDNGRGIKMAKVGSAVSFQMNLKAFYNVDWK